MTNKEILRSDILDILFEKRNKAYGAYALRRGYDKRLLLSLGLAMSVILVFILIKGLGNSTSMTSPAENKKHLVELTEVILPEVKPREPEKPKEIIKAKEQPKPIVKVAREKFTSKIEIKPDKLVKDPVPPVTSLGDKEISDKKETGIPATSVPITTKAPEVTGTGTTTVVTEPVSVFKPVERNPEFPGGPEALSRFLSSNLKTPEDLNDGEKKTVLIRFKVDKDGSVNTFEIVTSGGGEFDREVVRVCKKMPRWMPALQNGMNVPVSYVLPVTFIGVEQ